MLPETTSAIVARGRPRLSDEISTWGDPRSEHSSAPTSFDELLELMRSGTGDSGDDSTLLAHAGELLTGAFRDPAGGAVLLSSWADGLEAGAGYDRGRSQVHNNGFAKISLGRLDGGWNVRLHVWPRGQGDARIHDHRWSFASIAVAGALDVMNHTIDPESPEGFSDRYRLYDATGDGAKRLEQVDSVRLRPSSSYRITQGSFHMLDYRDPHIVWNHGASDAVTLMLSGPPRRQFSHSYGPRTDSSVLPAPDSLSDRDAVRHVREVVDRLRRMS